MRPVILAIALLAAGAWPALAAPKLGGQTHMFHDPGHGTQVEYLKSDGTAHLWYPGNSIVLHGGWKQEGGNICFRYGANSYNPVTGHQGGGWECAPAQHYWGHQVEQARGDVFGLAEAGGVPFALPRARTTIAALRYGSAPRADAAPTAESLGLPSCQAIVDAAETSKAAMLRAGLLYYHGMQMGKKCVKVDYVRAFDLVRRAGEARTHASLLKDLRQKAESGNPRAVTALGKIDLSPF